MTTRELRRDSPPTGLVWTNVVLVWLIWGSTYLGIALAIETAPPMWAMAVRLVGAGILLSIFVSFTDGPRALRVSPREAVTAGGMGIVMLTCGIGAVALAERYVPVGVAALLVATSPVWAIFLRTATGDRPHQLTWVGVALGLVGLALLLRPGDEGMTSDRLVWSIVIVLGQILWAAGSFLTPRLRMPKLPLVLVSYEMVIGGVAFFIWSGLLHEQVDLSVISTRSWVGIAYLTTAGAVGYAAYTWLLRRVPLSLAMTYAYVNPIVAVILGWLILGQQITLALALGGVITVAGVALVISGERSAVRAPE